ncbi:hypothetical protein HY612_00715 [Candidatus Roizmanbacteria bacterium]|nr:hypothetical protein [Candidatus Roizmanbacteria bacterium]
MRAYGRKNCGGILTPDFGDYLRYKVYRPGFSKPWRQLLREATGENLKPVYFQQEMQELSTRL